MRIIENGVETIEENADIIDEIEYDLDDSGICQGWNSEDAMNAADAADEPALIARIAEGDQAAFGKIYSRYVDRLWSYVHRILKTNGIASLCDDVILQTFGKLLDKASEIEVERTVGPWLYKVARNKALDEIRKQGKLARCFDVIQCLDDGISEMVHDPRCKSPLEMAILKENLVLAKQLISGLPERLKEVFEDFVFNEMSVEQIACKYSRPKGTVLWSIHRAREILKEQF